MGYIKMILVIPVLVNLFIFLTGKGVAQSNDQRFSKIEIWDLFELSISNNNVYQDPFREVILIIELRSPDGRILNHYGFYDGENNWKIRFSPDEIGKWDYTFYFTDEMNKTQGSFLCIPTERPGRIRLNKYNPFWLGKGYSPKTLFRSFHIGDRFFAENWDNPKDDDDGNRRTKFLDWMEEGKYNMLSIASFFTNRNENGRGKGWKTPDLWPLQPKEYQKLEAILDMLKERDITIFPFAGFFGAKGDWPVLREDQEVYIRYILARIGHYPNIIFNVAGPEPFWREAKHQYKGAMRLVDILRLGSLIDSLDVHDHIMTVHNEKRASSYGDPFIDEPWLDMSTLQGPTTTDIEKLFSGLIMNHHRYKTTYAQETLWPGNKFHPKYDERQLRKNILTILFSGAILNYADMDGNSSSGFSGSLNLDELDTKKHEIAKKVWDWFETIPFHQMTSRQDLVKQGFCLADEGIDYYIYVDTLDKVELHLDFPYMLQSEWINAQNPTDIRLDKTVNQKTIFSAPNDGDDWILHVYAPKPMVVSEGNFPDMAIGPNGDIHLVYNKDGLRYKKYDVSTKSWDDEQAVDCLCENIKRSDPDIVIDSQNRPHVFCGKIYATIDNGEWVRSLPGGKRDTELAIDTKDNIYLVHRGGNNGGHIGLLKKHAQEDEWEIMPDPDRVHLSKNDHVYPDMFIDTEDGIHLVQRHGPTVEVTYRFSSDGGKTWVLEEEVMDERSEAPHIVTDNKGTVFISTGKGFVAERLNDKGWKKHGRRLHAYGRMQPELGVDAQGNIYLSSFGGQYNIFYKGVWMGERLISLITENPQVGFVETVGIKDFAYIVWEEGSGNPDEGLGENAKIIVGILYPDGRIVGLY